MAGDFSAAGFSERYELTMLPKLFPDIDRDSDIYIKKFIDTSDVSFQGAFACGSKIEFELSVSRSLGASGAVMRICQDGCEDKDLPLLFGGSDNVHDVYTLILDTDTLCGEKGYGLFYYEFLLLRGYNTLFTSTYNNFDFVLSEKEDNRFRLLVFEKENNSPSALDSGVIYHIFVDRFARGDRECAKNIPIRDDAVINSDWEHGIPQYAKKAGGKLQNNEFFGGNLWGVAQKLDYLKSLGVTYIYLSPIFEAYSNHKYDTGDYTKIDEMFGGEEAFKNLIAKANECGIGIILDGVFNHTGDDSVYFNRYKRYGHGGAYNDSESGYKNWYLFKNWPDEYESWWGIEILPKLNHNNDMCRNFFVGEHGIAEKYTEMGITGWRLDVADELSDRFLDEFRTAVKKKNRDAVIIGEVWENACDKIAYGKRRRYFSGRQLDSVMNYPIRNAIISFCQFGDGEELYNTLTEIYSSYPIWASNRLMNLLGTHDTERIFTVLGSDFEDLEGENDELAHRCLSNEKRERAMSLLKIAATLQYTVYGIPSVYYGDEVGVEGYHDPFCRKPFPWHEINNGYRKEILDYYRLLGSLRNEHEALKSGDFYFVSHAESSVIFVRQSADDMLVVAANRGQAFSIEIPEGVVYRELISGTDYVGCAEVHSDSVSVFTVVPLN